MLRRGLARRFGLGSLLKKAAALPRRFMNLSQQPAENNSTYGNTTGEAFDAVSQEWQSVIVGNTYDLQAMAYYDAVAQMNFGTVDNPHVIYTADTPFRYVGCTGQPNEDDYEGHEFLIFMLREGPLQRCPQCGQVYKLVRLRNEISEEMDYYKSGQLPISFAEMGEADHWSQNSFMRLMPTSFEHTQFENNSFNTYTLVNPDDHDRILTDPAYRLERIKKAQDAAATYMSALRLVDQEFEANNPNKVAVPIDKNDYQTMIDTEIAILKTDRMYTNLRKFYARQYLDPQNHARREARRKQRVTQRQVDSYTVYYGGLSESEQQIKDYFETEYNNGEHLEEGLQEAVDEEFIRSLPDYKTSLYDFQELYTTNPQEDASSIEDKLVFRFVHRRAIDTASNFERRQKRLFERSVARVNKVQAALNQQAAEAYSSRDQARIKAVEGAYIESAINEAINQYGDYFETEGEDAIQTLRNGSSDTKVALLEGYRDYTKLGTQGQRGFYSIPKRAWNNRAGVLSNTAEELSDLTNYVLPRAKELKSNLQLNVLAGRAADYQAAVDQIQSGVLASSEPLVTKKK